MCQMSIMLDKKGQSEKIMENATQLEVTPDGVKINTLFEEPRLVPKAVVKKIDFMGGITTLAVEDASS